MMRNKMKYVGSCMLLSALLAGCTEKFDWSGGLKETDLVFQTYMPSEGSKGTELSIRGNNFGNDISRVQVWINGKEAEVLSVSPTRIIAKVAEGSGSGVVKVKVGDTEYSYPDTFSYGFVRKVYTLAGSGQDATTDGAAASAAFQWPISLAYDNQENALLVLQDEGQKRIRRVKDGKVETLLSTVGMLNNPRAICLSSSGDTLFIGNDNANNVVANPVAVAIVTRKGGFKDLKSYIASGKYADPNINGIAVSAADGSVFTYHWGKHVYRYDPKTQQCVEVITRDQLNELMVGLFPDAGGNNQNIGSVDGGNYGNLAMSPDGKTLYISGRDPYQGILKADYDPATGKCANLVRFAGNGVWGTLDGTGTGARMDQPFQMAVDKEGNLFVSNVMCHLIRKVTPAGVVSTYAGVGYGPGYADGLAADAKFDQPHGMAVDEEGVVYVGDGINRRIRQIKNE